MEKITRKTMLYKTGVEYGDYTMNHVLGCSHGCKYPCYAFMMKKRFGQVNSYDEWCKPKLVANTLELLDTEIPRLKDKIKSVHLCFSTDPFPYVDEGKRINRMSGNAIGKLNDAGIKSTVLTKGLLPTFFILPGYLKQNEYGISLVSLDENFREQYEPNTAPYRERIAALKYLHDNGCKTWVSMEPFPTPNLGEVNHIDIINAVSFADKIVFGRWNYNKEVTNYLRADRNFYAEIAHEVIGLCKEHGIELHIKKGTIA